MTNGVQQTLCHRPFFTFILMKNLFFIPLLALSLVLNLTACSDDDDAPGLIICPPESAFWELPHTRFLGLNGEVKKLKETVWADVEGEEEEGTTTLMHFNTYGQLTYYNPTGVEENRWIGMPMDSYTYVYDEQHRLQQACISTLNGGQTCYTLTYGNDNRYIPLPFALGTMDFFLVKGITDIKAEGTAFTCTRTPATVTYITQMKGWRETIEIHTEYTYKEGNPYPQNCKIWEIHDGTETDVERTTYTFSTNGRLLKRIRHDYEDNTIQTTEKQTFHASLPLCLNDTETSDSDQLLFRHAYTYEAHGWLSAVTKIQNGKTEQETYAYTKTDTQGNWTEGHFTWSSRVDPAHWNGSFRITRDLHY